MTESTWVKGEMHFHSGFLASFGTIKQQGVRSFRGILPTCQGPVPDSLGGGGAYSVSQAPAEGGNDLRS